MSNPTVIVIPAGSSTGPRFPTGPSVQPPAGGRPARRGVFSGIATALFGLFTSAGGGLLVVLAAGISASDSSVGRGVAGLTLVVVGIATLFTLAVTAGFASLAYRRNTRTGVLWAVLGTALALVGVIGGVSALASLLT